MPASSICVLDGYTVNPGDNPWTPLESLGDVTVYDRTDLDLIVSRAKDASILLTNKTPLSAESLSRLPKLRFISVLATGYDIVDVEAARAQGVPVSNVPVYSTQSVAQFTFALILDRCHRIGQHSDAVMGGRWQASEHFCFWDTPQMELAGKTLGIIGYGRIGREVSKLASAFGMTVLVHTRSQAEDEPGVTVEWVSLGHLAARSDVITLHCPATPQTVGMIDAEFIGKMKSSALLINTARGTLLDEKALAEALNAGTIAGAACDVASSEPLASDNPLLTAKNLTLTPHMAWATLEARRRLMQTTADNVRAFLGGNPINVING